MYQINYFLRSACACAYERRTNVQRGKKSQTCLEGSKVSMLLFPPRGQFLMKQAWDEHSNTNSTRHNRHDSRDTFNTEQLILAQRNLRFFSLRSDTPGPFNELSEDCLKKIELLFSSSVQSQSHFCARLQRAKMGREKNPGVFQLSFQAGVLKCERIYSAFLSGVVPEIICLACLRLLLFSVCLSSVSFRR